MNKFVEPMFITETAESRDLPGILLYGMTNISSFAVGPAWLQALLHEKFCKRAPSGLPVTPGVFLLVIA